MIAAANTVALPVGTIQVLIGAIPEEMVEMIGIAELLP